ncbi:S-layer homology domain-containing protein [Alteribacillus sp. YIM 98480]|uniref:S-layer homology domain-containing protein n=1 Tax=Alteribacillus sp. YIM 98480 TaxID=2606599 RepID=UPI00131C8497|nr:S-layer homology domain-containing protein [Alteribacillus sp. YIM 98480]
MWGKISSAAAGILAAGVLAVTPASAKNSFTDVEQDFWADDQIYYLSEQGVINGYRDGTFRPSQEITRHQVAGMIVKALDLHLDNRPDPGFTDVDEDSTNYKSIAAVADEGILRGSKDEFRPGEFVTRGQMAAIVSRAFDLERSNAMQFIDVEHDYWTFGDISTVTTNRIASGYEDGAFKPGDPTTRAQFSVFLTRAMDEEERPDYINTGIAPRGTEINTGKESFRNEGNRIIRIDENGEETPILDEEDFEGDYCDFSKDCYNSAPGLGKENDLFYHDGWLYFVVHSTSSEVEEMYNNDWYRVRLDGREKTKLFGSPDSYPADSRETWSYSNFSIIGDQLYYLEKEDLSNIDSTDVHFVRSDLDGSNKEVIAPLSVDRIGIGEKPGFSGVDHFHFYIDGRTVVYANDGVIYRMNIDGSGQTRIYDGNYRSFYFEDGKIIIETRDGKTEEFDK